MLMFHNIKHVHEPCWFSDRKCVFFVAINVICNIFDESGNGYYLVFNFYSTKGDLR